MSDVVGQAEAIGQELLHRLDLLSVGQLRGEISLAQYRMIDSPPATA